MHEKPQQICDDQPFAVELSVKGPGASEIMLIKLTTAKD